MKANSFLSHRRFRYEVIERFFLWIATGTLLISCRTVRPTESPPSFIGGEQAREGQFPASLSLGGCTASKLSSYFILTAGHCVQNLDGNLYVSPLPNATLTVKSGVLSDAAKKFQLPLARTLIHYTYRNTARMTESQRNDELRSGRTRDLAILEVCRSTPVTNDCFEFAKLKSARLPAAEQDGIEVGKRMAVGGYGREAEESKERRILNDTSGFIITEGDEGSRLKSASVPIAELFPNVAGFSNAVEAVITDIGKEHIPTLKLGGGDSGGPVYLDDRPDGVQYEDHSYFMVVGINSFSITESSFFTSFDWKRQRQEIQCVESILRDEQTEIVMNPKGFGEICRQQTAKK
jgi:hypothetical protein